MSEKTTLQQYPRLAAQNIDENQPGSILADFNVLLAFMEQGLKSSGKYHLLPMSRLFEIDRLMTRPLIPNLKRPQQRSFPNLNGLYMLSRATQLGVTDGQSGGRLTLDQEAYKEWVKLNPTEQYFALLEAWLRWSSWGAVGFNEGRSWGKDAGQTAFNTWSSIPAQGRRFSRKENAPGSYFFNIERSCTLALFELFGLLAIERAEPDAGQNWRVTEIRPTPFGAELMGLISDEYLRTPINLAQGQLQVGAWQPLLRPFFPQWVHNYKIPEPKFRDGTYYFKVSLGMPWRRIAIPATSDLEELAACIISAFEFDGDHLYAYRCVGRDGRQVVVADPEFGDGDLYTDEVAIGELPLGERESMEFEYDFGAGWRFDVHLEKIEPKCAKVTEAKVVASRGKAPDEYECEDW